VCVCGVLAQELYKEISSLHQVFSANPIFGIDFTVEDPVRACFCLLWLITVPVY
jgi:hypothetical protein